MKAAISDPLRERMVSLDVFRGLTVALMILVNNPGSWSHVYEQLDHAPWNGWTLTDTVFPFFLFIVGVAMALSFAKRRKRGAVRKDLVRKVLSRAAIIFAMGLFLNGFPFNVPFNSQDLANFHWSDIPGRFATIRWMGVLQRIALCYLITGLIILYVPSNRKRLLTGLGLLALYELLMRLPLVPGWGHGSFELENSFARWLDLQILHPQHMYHGKGIAFDPEGLVSTLTAAVTTLSGYFVGEYLRRPLSLHKKLTNLLVAGIVLFFLGGLLSPWEPINKRLWTVPYVILMDGLALIMVVFSSWIIDVRHWQRWIKPAVVFGSNPLVVFLGSGILGRLVIRIKWHTGGEFISLKGWLYHNLCVPLAGPMNGSLLYAVGNVLLWTAILWWLYEKRIFIKV